MSRFRESRPAGFLLALLVEGLLVLVILTLGSSIAPRGEPSVTEVRFRAASEQEQRAQPKDDSRDDTPKKADRAESPRPPTPTPPSVPPQPRTVEVPKALPPQIISLSPRQMAAANIAPQAPAAPASRPAMGPPAPAGGADTPRVSGSGPDGEPLYAASWYREPYKDELSGYLSTATGPGWGLIACRTAPEYRVEDCVKVDEYPTGSNIARAILAAAWQFRVRPPRIGGQPRIGEWVRIRIDYDLRPATGRP